MDASRNLGIAVQTWVGPLVYVSSWRQIFKHPNFLMSQGPTLLTLEFGLQESVSSGRRLWRSTGRIFLRDQSHPTGVLGG